MTSWLDCWKRQKPGLGSSVRDKIHAGAPAASRGGGAARPQSIIVLEHSGAQVSRQGAVTLFKEPPPPPSHHHHRPSESGYGHHIAQGGTPRAVLRLVSHARLGDLPLAAAKRAVTLDASTATAQPPPRRSCSGAGGVPRMGSMGAKVGSRSLGRDLREMRDVSDHPHVSFGGPRAAASAADAATSCLLPVHVNAAVFRHMDLLDEDDYSEFLCKMLWRDELLLGLVRDVCAALVAGDARSVHHIPAPAPPPPSSHHLPRPSSDRWSRQLGTPLYIQACYCRAPDGTLEPSLVLEHDLPTDVSVSPNIFNNSSHYGHHHHHGNGVGGGGGAAAAAPSGPCSFAAERRFVPDTSVRPPDHNAAAGDSHHGGGTATAHGSHYGGGASAHGSTMRPSILSHTNGHAHGDPHNGGGGSVYRTAPTSPIGGGALRNSMSTAWRSSKSIQLSDSSDLMRSLAVLAHCPLVTLLDMDGGVLFQNAASRKYWGALVLSPVAVRKGARPVKSQQLLEQLFSMQPHWCGTAVEEVEAGRKWRRILDVPATSKRWSQQLMRKPQVVQRSASTRGRDEVTTTTTAATAVTTVPIGDLTPRAMQSPRANGGGDGYHTDQNLSLHGGAGAAANRRPGKLRSRRYDSDCGQVRHRNADEFEDILPSAFGRPLGANGAAGLFGRGGVGNTSNSIDESLPGSFTSRKKLLEWGLPGGTAGGGAGGGGAAAAAAATNEDRTTASNVLLMDRHSGHSVPDLGALHIQASERLVGSPKDKSRTGGSIGKSPLGHSESLQQQAMNSMAGQIMSRAPSRHVMAFVSKAVSAVNSFSPSRAESSRLPRFPSSVQNLLLDGLDSDEDIDTDPDGTSLSVNENSPELSLEDEVAWHELQLTMIMDPVSGTQVLLLLQEDVTQRAVLEHHLSALMEAQFSMMEQMFPRHAMEYLMENDLRTVPENLGQLANMHESVTILFTDIVGFTSMSKAVSPGQVMDLLNKLFTLFDKLARDYAVYKVETAGDCYIVAGGLMEEDDDGFQCVAETDEHPEKSAQRVLAFAKALQLHSRSVLMPHTGTPVQVRVGIHTGPVVTGVIGIKLPKFSVFGTTMNTASRMESTCPVGCVQVTEATMKLLDDDTLEATAGIEIKGLGTMSTYLWRPPTTDAAVAATLQAVATKLVQQRVPGAVSFKPGTVSFKISPHHSRHSLGTSSNVTHQPSFNRGSGGGAGATTGHHGNNHVSRPITAHAAGGGGGGGGVASSALSAAVMSIVYGGGNVAGTTLWNGKDDLGHDDFVKRRRVMLLQGYGEKRASAAARGGGDVGGVSRSNSNGFVSRCATRGGDMLADVMAALNECETDT